MRVKFVAGTRRHGHLQVQAFAAVVDTELQQSRVSTRCCRAAVRANLKELRNRMLCKGGCEGGGGGGSGRRRGIQGDTSKGRANTRGQGQNAAQAQACEETEIFDGGISAAVEAC